MKKQQIEFVIGEDGEIEIRVSGATGGQCLSLTKDIEAALGLVTNRQMTGEYYDAAASTTEQVKSGS